MTVFAGIVGLLCRTGTKVLLREGMMSAFVDGDGGHVRCESAFADGEGCHLSLSSEQLVVKAPIVTIVEVKNDNIKSGWGQCVAEMVGAQVFNRAKGNPIKTIYGVVTTGTNRRFLRFIDTSVYVDRTEYYLRDVEKIVGILLSMLHEAAKQQLANGAT